jgi:hypothetical protein
LCGRALPSGFMSSGLVTVESNLAHFHSDAAHGGIRASFVRLRFAANPCSEYWWPLPGLHVVSTAHLNIYISHLWMCDLHANQLFSGPEKKKKPKNNIVNYS